MANQSNPLNNAPARRRRLALGAAAICSAILMNVCLTVAAATVPDSRPEAPPAAPAPTTATAPAGAADTMDFVRVITDDDKLYDAGYYELVKRLAGFSPDRVKTVTVDDLKATPDDYRGKPVRMELVYIDVKKPETNSEVAGGKAFGIRAVVGMGRNARPVVVLAQTAPPKMKKYEKFEVLGFFFKVASLPKADGSEGSIDTPVIISYQVNPLGRPAEGGGGVAFQYAATAIVLAVLVGAWFLVRYRLSRPTARTGSLPQYKPLRFEMTPEELERTKVSIPPPDASPPQPPGPRVPPAPGL